MRTDSAQAIRNTTTGFSIGTLARKSSGFSEVVYRCGTFLLFQGFRIAFGGSYLASNVQKKRSGASLDGFTVLATAGGDGARRSTVQGRKKYGELVFIHNEDQREGFRHGVGVSLQSARRAHGYFTTGASAKTRCSGDGSIGFYSAKKCYGATTTARLFCRTSG